MKKSIARLLACIILVGNVLACVSVTRTPTAGPTTSPEPRATAIPTLPEATPSVQASGIPSSLICREKPGNDLPFRTWRNVDSHYGHYTTGVPFAGPVAEGDNVWISTNSGLARLNLKTWQCDLFTQAAGITLTNISLVVLPDGEGGLWVGAGEYLLRWIDEEWQVAYEAEISIIAMGLSQTGGLCLEMFKYYHRGFTTYRLCFSSSDIPLPVPEKIEDCYGEDCPLNLSNCDVWQRASHTWDYAYIEGSITGGYTYASPYECERLLQTRAALGPSEGASVSVASSPGGGAGWAVKSEYLENDVLFYQREGSLRQEEIPYDVLGLGTAVDGGGAWLTVRDGLVYAEANEDGAAQGFDFRPLAIDFQAPSLDAGLFPGEARGLAVDRADHVWAVNGRSVLLYDETSESWQEVASPGGGADVISADIERGVWVAGRGELVHFDWAHQQAWPMPDTLISAPTALLADGAGRVWMGTTENGVWVASPLSKPAGRPLDWHMFTLEDGLESLFITAMARSPDGHIYAAHHAGISIFDPSAGTESGRWVTLPSSDLSEFGWVNALAFTPDGHLWAGTHAEWGDDIPLWYYDGVWTNQPSAVSNVSIGALLVDREGTLWVGTGKVWTCGRLWRRPASSAAWQAIDPKGLVLCNVFALAQDGQGRVWVGGSSGVVMLAGGS